MSRRECSTNVHYIICESGGQLPVPGRPSQHDVQDSHTRAAPSVLLHRCLNKLDNLLGNTVSSKYVP